MSREEENRIEDLKDVEAALAALVPRGDRIDRDRLMFLAGQASAGTPCGDMPTTGVKVAGDGWRVARWAWPSSFAAMSAVAATLLVMLLARPEPQIVERIVQVPVPGKPALEGMAPPESTQYAVLGTHPPVLDTQYSVPSTRYSALSTPSPSRDSYHDLLKQVLDRGLDAWKPPAGSGVTVTAAAPVKYRKLLETLLESPAS